MDTFRQLRERLRKSSQSPAMVCEILDDTLTALDHGLSAETIATGVEQVIQRSLADRPVSEQGVPMQTYAQAKEQIVRLVALTDAATQIDRLAHQGVPCLLVGDERVQMAIAAMLELGWTWRGSRSRLEHSDMVIRVARSAEVATGCNAGALWLCGGSAHMLRVAQQTLRLDPRVTITTFVTDPPRDAEPERLPDAPVLPPGCRMGYWAATPAWSVVGRNGDPVAVRRTEHGAAEAAWLHFGAFMSREDYEALAHDAGRAQRLQQDMGDMVKVHNQSAEIMRRAHEALDVAGVERESTFPGGPVARKVYGLAERVRMLASKVGEAQAGEAYGREVAEQEVERLRDRVAAQESWGQSINEAHEALARAGIRGTGPLARKIDDLADLHKQTSEQRDEYWSRLCAAEKRTEAHRLEIGRMTDTIQRLRGEITARAQDAETVCEVVTACAKAGIPAPSKITLVQDIMRLGDTIQRLREVVPPRGPLTFRRTGALAAEHGPMGPGVFLEAGGKIVAFVTDAQVQAMAQPSKEHSDG
jgi:hypothetical protein